MRDEMGFEGVCISDYGAVSNVHRVQHVGEDETEAGCLCLEAGLDIEMPSAVCYGAGLKKRIEEMETGVELLDEAVLRVLTAKFRMGLFDHPFALAGEELKKRCAMSRIGQYPCSRQRNRWCF